MQLHSLTSQSILTVINNMATTVRETQHTHANSAGAMLPDCLQPALLCRFQVAFGLFLFLFIASVCISFALIFIYIYDICLSNVYEYLYKCKFVHCVSYLCECSIIAYTIQLYFLVMEVWTLGFVPTKELFVVSCFRCQQNKLNEYINYNL